MDTETRASDDVITFGPGVWVHNAAKQLVDQIGTREHVCLVAEFNGTPMVAYSGETVAEVVMRWRYERQIIQIRNGVVTAEQAVRDNAHYARDYSEAEGGM